MKKKDTLTNKKKTELYPKWCINSLYVLSILGLVVSVLMFPIIGCGLGGCSKGVFVMMLVVIGFIFVLPLLAIELQKQYSLRWGYLLLIPVVTDLIVLLYNAQEVYFQFRLYFTEILFSIFGLGILAFIVLVALHLFVLGKFLTHQQKQTH